MCVERKPWPLGATGLLILTLLLAACGGGGGGGGGGAQAPATTYTVSASVSGLAGSVQLADGHDNLTITADGTYVFPTGLLGGSRYNVSVLAQPAGQTCTVTGGTGTLSGNVTATVTCANNSYTIGGSVSGLSGAVALLNNGADSLTLSATGSFVFATPVANGQSYNVTVGTQPAGQTCTVANGSGPVSGGNVTTVAVACSANTYSLGGTIAGPATGTVTLNDGIENFVLTASTVSNPFTFPTKLASGAVYNVQVVSAPAGWGCTVTGGGGTIAADVTNVGVSCALNSYTVGGTVTGLNGSMVLQNNGADNLTASSGNFTFATALPYGSGYDVTKLSQQFPNQKCTITGGAGTVTANVTSVTIACAPYNVPRYAYTANTADNSVSAYVVDAASGRLKYIGKAPAGTNPVSVAVDPSGRYVYVANQGSGNVSQYAAGADGALTQMASVAAGTGAKSIAVDPTGRYVYVANYGSNNVSQYAIGPSGALQPMTPVATVAAGTGPNAIAVDPTGQYVYVANSFSNNISQYTIGAGGALQPMTPVATVAAGTAPMSIAVDPGGQYAYVANLTGSDVWRFTVGAGGGLSAGTSVAIASRPTGIAIDPSGKFAYVVNGSGSTVTPFQISNGTLTALAQVATGTSPASVTVDPSGKYVYVANAATPGTVLQYAINAATGAPAPLAPASVPDMAGPASIAVLAGAAPAQAVPQYAYVANDASNNVSQYNIGASGVLAAMTTATAAAGANPTGLAATPDGKCAYAVDWGSNSITPFTVGTGGALTAIAVATAGSGPNAIAMDPAGRYVYAANSDGTVSQFTVNSGNCALAAMAASAVGVATTGQTLSAIAVDPSGRYAYAADMLNKAVIPYTIGPAGALTQGASIPISAIPAGLAIDPAGQYLYVATSDTGAVYQFPIGASGTLGVGTFLILTPGLNGIAVDPAGMYVYVTNLAANSVTVVPNTAGLVGTLASYVTGSGPFSVAVDPSGKYVYVANSLNGTGGNTVSQFKAGGGSLTSPATVATGANPRAVMTIGTWQ